MTDRFRIGERVYNMSALDEISLRDIVVFNTQVADLGLKWTWADIEATAAGMDGMDASEAESHPDAYMMIAVTVWASRRVAGDQVTFEEAISIPMKSLTFLEEPQDKQAPARPTKRAAAKKSLASAPADAQDHAPAVA